MTLSACRNRALTVALLCTFAASAPAQRSLSGETKMRMMLDEIGNLGSVMMIAAHPDDENTALLAYLARGLHVRTAYLSLTRGEGGQNLIGGEQGDELGIIRTQELLAARRIDGAEQYFTRAIDFGFSKTAEETLAAKWPRKEVLGDVVWAIRRFRPDVIILRFTGTPRDGHAHHQASAILAREAFAAAADPAQYPEQLQYVQTWQVQRLMTNLATFNRDQEKEAEKLPEKLTLDLGAYSPQLGYSYGEIAGMSRSQHRSQSMGTAERRGEALNYFVTDRGDKATKTIFDHINIGWSRVAGGGEVSDLLAKAAAAFVPDRPENLIPLLAQARSAMAKAVAGSENPLAQRKLAELDEALALAAGVWVEALTDKAAATPNSEVKITLSALARNPAEVTVIGAKLSGLPNLPGAAVSAAKLELNKPRQYPVTVKIPANQPYTQPYWLELPRRGAMYTVSEQRQIGDPENPPLMTAEFRLKVGGEEITLKRPVEYRYVDRVYGELTRPFTVVPPVSLEFGGTAMIFTDNRSRRVEIPVKSNEGKVAGDVRLGIPSGWKVAPTSQHFDLSATNEQSVVAFDLTPPAAESQGILTAFATIGNQRIALDTRVIDYPHIPAQTLFTATEAKLARIQLTNLSRNVGYIEGAGDEVPEALRQMGCEVTLLSKDDLVHGDLSRFDAIVTGVRAFNTRADLRANYQRLFKFAEDGGTLIVQYNTPDGGPPGTPVPETSTLAHIGPYPIKTGRDRVTIEEVPVSFPHPNLVLLHYPNEITERDFDGWIQERGLNFPSEWDKRYISVLESHDPGEKPQFGGELYTRYGKGAYISTSYDWFRELPGGVPGAYRLFANMLSVAKVQ